MKSIIHIFKTYKPLIILLLILFLFIKIGFQVKYLTYQENFYSVIVPTHSLVIYALDKKIDALVPDLKNLIVKNANTVKSGAEEYLENGFLNIYNQFGKTIFAQNSYTTDIPQLIIHSYNECPTLFNLFRAYPKLGAENNILALSNKVNRIFLQKQDKETKALSEKEQLDSIETEILPYYILYDIFQLRLKKMELLKNLGSANQALNVAANEAEKAVAAVSVATEKDAIQDTETKITEKKLLLSNPSAYSREDDPNNQENQLQTLKYYFLYQIEYNVYHLDNLKTSLNKIPVLKTQLEKIQSIIVKFPGKFKNDCYKIFLQNSNGPSIIKQITDEIKSLHDVLTVKFKHTNTDKDQTNIDQFNFSIDNLVDFELPPNSITTEVDPTYIEKIKAFVALLDEYQKNNTANTFYLFTDEQYNNFMRIKNFYIFIHNIVPTPPALSIEKDTSKIPYIKNITSSLEIQGDTGLDSFISFKSKNDDPFSDSPSIVIDFVFKKHIILKGNYNNGAGTEEFKRDFKNFLYFEKDPVPESMVRANADIGLFQKQFFNFICDLKNIKSDIIDLETKIEDDTPKYNELKEKDEKTDDDETFISEYDENNASLVNKNDKKTKIEEQYSNLEINNFKKIYDSLDEIGITIEEDLLFKTYHFYRILSILVNHIISEAADSDEFRNYVAVNDNSTPQDITSKTFFSFSFETDFTDPANTKPIKMDLYKKQNISQITGAVVNLDYDTIGSKIEAVQTATGTKTVTPENITQYFDSLGFKNEGELATNHDNFKTLIGQAITYLNTDTRSLDTKTFSEAELTAYKTRAAHVANTGQKLVIGASPTVAQDIQDYIDIIIHQDKINYLNAEADLLNFIEYMRLLKQKNVIQQQLTQTLSNLKTKTEEYFKQEDLLDIIEKQYRQNENQTGIQHRMKIQKEFFNLSQEVRVDYPLLDILVYDNPITTNKIVPQIYFRNNKIEYGNQIANTPKQEYIVKLTATQKLYDEKQTHFDVKGDFSFPDILKFMDYSFTCLCWGAINIRLMKHTNNHYYAFPCQNDKCQNLKNKYFYLLPTKIAQLCQEEGKEYTRAKCNRCASNVIVYFDKIPQKFLNLFNSPINPQQTTALATTPNLFT